MFANSPYTAAASAASSSEYSATAAGLSVVFAGMAILAMISGAAFGLAAAAVVWLLGAKDTPY